MKSNEGGAAVPVFMMCVGQRGACTCVCVCVCISSHIILTWLGILDKISGQKHFHLLYAIQCPQPHMAIEHLKCG